MLRGSVQFKLVQFKGQLQIAFFATILQEDWGRVCQHCSPRLNVLPNSKFWVCCSLCVLKVVVKIPPYFQCIVEFTQQFSLCPHDSPLEREVLWYSCCFTNEELPFQTSQTWPKVTQLELVTETAAYTSCFLILVLCSLEPEFQIRKKP